MELSELYKYIENPGLLNNDSLEGLKELTIKYPYFQVAWLLYLKDLKLIKHPKFEEELSNVAIYIADRKKLYHYLNRKTNNTNINSLGYDYNLEVWNSSSGENKEGKDNLIDSFIRSQPSIIFNKDADNVELRSDVAEKSILESDEFITETLANILVQQKKYDKAINAFEKLSLKFPEKSSYFAGRINEVKELKNN